MKVEKGFPAACLRELKDQLKTECCKLKAMVSRAIDDKLMDCDKVKTLFADRESLKAPETPSDISSLSAFTDFDFAESLITDNENLESDRYKLQEEILLKDESVQDLQAKLDQMHCQLIKLCRDNKIMSEKLAKTNDSGSREQLKCQVKMVTESAEKLVRNFQQMEAQLCELRKELCRLKKEKEISEEKSAQTSTRNSVRISTTVSAASEGSSPCPARPTTCPPILKQSPAELRLKQVQSQYTNLQSEYCRQEKQCKEMAERMKHALDDCNDNKDRAENEALKHRADELSAEVNDYKVFIKELQEQVEMNREKFMKGEIGIRLSLPFVTKRRKS